MLIFYPSLSLHPMPPVIQNRGKEQGPGIESSTVVLKGLSWILRIR